MNTSLITDPQPDPRFKSFKFPLPMGNGARDHQPTGAGNGKFTFAHLCDDSLKRLDKRYRRELVDVQDGDLPGGRRRERLLQAQIHDVESEQAVREALREHWHAEPFGCDSTAAFARETADGPLIPLTEHGPSYRIAILFDYERAMRGESTALLWKARS